MDNIPKTQNWQRWPPHQPGPDYVMMDHSGHIQYDSRSQSTATSRPAIPPSFVLEQSYTMAPMTPMPATHYPVHNTFVFNAYASQASESFVSSSKQYPAGRPQLDMASTCIQELPEPLGEANHPHAESLSRSPVVKSEPQPFDKPKDSKSITPNTAEGQAHDVVFHTDIDKLMKVIQQKTDRVTTTSVAQPAPQHSGDRRNFEISTNREELKADDACNTALKDKPHACRRKKCHKRFTQTTHLNIHDRAHTGERPHRCTFAGCDKSFTQKGNLRTHERRHTGERPFKCHVQGCTKAFPQKGNLAAHLETHFRRNSFRCILKSCGKSFSSRGNLKTHQNNYHKEHLRELELKFSNLSSVTEMSEDDRELWNYFLTVHKNSNKGIKGRGKECRVELIPRPGGLSNHCSIQSPPELQHIPFPVSHGLPHSMGFSHFGIQRNNLGQDFLAARDAHVYGVYDMDQTSISSGTMTPASSPGGMYEDHSRSLAFQDRMY
ncbi:hypothetical protein F5Y19DRAFT_468862 [Xylariaceae sp. FL1651]|nr:hypothetical protein F5Y19DRAFT_468862 [Xylariaceae sp. FL1651]